MNPHVTDGRADLTVYHFSTLMEMVAINVLHQNFPALFRTIAEMVDIPLFEIVPEHEFKVKEKVLVIDPNGYDLWDGIITSTKNGHFRVHYPEFPGDDQDFEDTSRILVDTRVNRRIFKTQEAVRQTQLPPLEEDEEEPFSDRSADEGDGTRDYAPNRATEKPKKPKKPKKAKKPKKDQTKQRPEGVRVSPRRSA
jgi:hypothetical protein